MIKQPLDVEDVNVKIYRQVLDGTLDRFPRNFWKEEYKSAPALVRYLIEEVLKWDEEDIKNNFTTFTLEQYKLAGLHKYVYKKNLFNVIDSAYPGRFKPWEMKFSPRSYWRNLENCINATRWLILEKLEWTKEDIMEKFNNNVFKENGFTGLLKWGWNGESYNAVALSFYEYDFKPWDLRSIHMTNLSKDEGITAIRWYIEEKMKWSEEEIKRNWRVRTIREDGIMRIVVIVFGNSMYDAINAAYPNRFKRWEFPVPNGYWTLDKAKEALRWVVLVKLELDPNEVCAKTLYEHLYNYNLRGMLELGFQTGLKEAIQLTFFEQTKANT